MKLDIALATRHLGRGGPAVTTAAGVVRRLCRVVQLPRISDLLAGFNLDFTVGDSSDDGHCQRGP